LSSQPLSITALCLLPNYEAEGISMSDRLAHSRYWEVNHHILVTSMS